MQTSRCSQLHHAAEQTPAQSQRVPHRVARHRERNPRHSAAQHQLQMQRLPHALSTHQQRHRPLLRLVLPLPSVRLILNARLLRSATAAQLHPLNATAVQLHPLNVLRGLVLVARLLVRLIRLRLHGLAAARAAQQPVATVRRDSRTRPPLVLEIALPHTDQGHRSGASPQSRRNRRGRSRSRPRSS